jgi:hypothetical protein
MIVASFGLFPLIVAELEQILFISDRDHGSGSFPAMIMMPGFTPWATARPHHHHPPSPVTKPAEEPVSVPK